MIPLRFPKVPQDLGILTVPYRNTPGALEHPGTLKKILQVVSTVQVWQWIFVCDGLATVDCSPVALEDVFRSEKNETKPTTRKIRTDSLIEGRSTPSEK